MPTKIFTTITGKCPFGCEPVIDSPGCRQCRYFYRAGTATFFWCNHPPTKAAASVLKKPRSVPKTTESVPKTTESVPIAPEAVPDTPAIRAKPRKRGRPAVEAKIKPVQARKTKKR